MKKIRKAVFPVGGLGTRFLPATKCMPKEMLTVYDKPLIQYAYEEAVEAGIEEFIFITGRNKDIIESHFDHAYELENTLRERGNKDMLEDVSGWLPGPGQVVFIRQQTPLGLGHAVHVAHRLIGDEPFALLLADEMLKSSPGFLKQMVDSYEGHSMIGVHKVADEDVSKYGIAAGEGQENRQFKIQQMVEKPTKHEAPSNLAIVGRYILEPEILSYLERAERGAGNEIQLTDAMKSMMNDGHSYDGFHFEGDRFDCGARKAFLRQT